MSQSRVSDILSELISEGERLSAPPPPPPSQPVPVPTTTTPSTLPSSTEDIKKFDELWVISFIITIAIFILFKVVFGRFFMKYNEFGEEVFATKKYIGVSSITSIVVNAGLWYYKKIYVADSKVMGALGE